MLLQDHEELQFLKGWLKENKISRQFKRKKHEEEESREAIETRIYMTDSSATSQDPGMAINNSLLKEVGDYKNPVQAHKTDARYTCPHVKELTQSHHLLSQNPRIRKKFNRLLNDSKSVFYSLSVRCS